MIKLYIDFDGVILDTIDVSYQMMKEQGIDLTIPNNPSVVNFYRNLDWTSFITKCTPIQHSIENIQKLVKSNLYDISILTHVNTQNEVEVKTEYIRKNIPNVDVIFVERKYQKEDMVDCEDAILVDDYMGNLKTWEAKGGIPVKFSTTGKKYHCLSIDRLDKLLELHSEILNLLSVKDYESHKNTCLIKKTMV